MEKCLWHLGAEKVIDAFLSNTLYKNPLKVFNQNDFHEN